MALVLFVYVAFLCNIYSQVAILHKKVSSHGHFFDIAGKIRIVKAIIMQYSIIAQRVQVVKGFLKVFEKIFEIFRIYCKHKFFILEKAPLKGFEKFFKKFCKST